MGRVTRRGLLRWSGAAAVVTTAGSVVTGAGPARAAVVLGRFYLGTYTSSGGKGIARGRVDPLSGRLVVDSWSTAVPDASWLDLSPTRPIMYAISEQTEGRVHALRLGSNGDPTPLNSRPTGSGPAHVTVLPGGRFLVTSMYGGGTVTVHPIATDGSVLGAADTKLHRGSTSSHAHQVVATPDGMLLAVDLGLDTVVAYAMDSGTGHLTETGRTALPSGSGPRHLAFHPNGSIAYLANEQNSTVTVCTWQYGRLTTGASLSTLPAGVGGTNYPGEIAVSADGRFVYVSNRGHNSVAVFATGDNGRTLRLVATPSCGGDWPRHLAISGSYLYVANQRSGDVTWFPLDKVTGIPGPSAGLLGAAGVAQIRFA